MLFQIDSRPFEIEIERLNAEIKRSQSKLDFATADRARAERLFSQNAIAREEYEQLTSAQAQAAGDLGSLTAQLHAAHLNLEYSHVRSPIDGHVSRALITPGNLVSNADLLTTVVSDDPIYAYFATAEATYLHDDFSLRTAVPDDEPANGHAHARNLLLQPSLTILVEEGELLIGQWQSVFAVELDGPRARSLRIQIFGLSGIG